MFLCYNFGLFILFSFWEWEVMSEGRICVEDVESL